MKRLLFSIDVEVDFNEDKSIISYNHIKNDLVPFLDYLMSNNISVTLFMTPQILDYNKKIFSKYIGFHEFGCHVHPELDERYKGKNKVFISTLTFAEQERLIKKSFDSIKNYTGKEPISFRASSHRINSLTLKAIEEVGFKVDSSILPPLHGKYIIEPYHPSQDNVVEIGNMKIIEFPVTVSYRFPLILKPFIFIVNLLLKKKVGVEFTAYKLKTNKFFGLLNGGYLVGYAINDLFKKYNVLSLYVHSYDLAETKVLYNLRKILSQHQKNYFVSSIQDFLKENDSFG